MVFLSLLTAIALGISLIETALPVPIPVPGARLGFSNIILLITIVLYGFREGLAVALLKSFLLMLLTGSVTGFFYSAAGALLATSAMAIAHRFLVPPFSLIGVSELGAFFHNIGQLLVASFVLSNRGIFYYLPVLTLTGLATGFFVGLSSGYLADHLTKVFHFTKKQ